jgi:hypothetical protein
MDFVLVQQKMRGDGLSGSNYCVQEPLLILIRSLVSGQRMEYRYRVKLMFFIKCKYEIANLSFG